MRKIIGLTAFALFLLAGTVESYAQQFGYLNSALILEELEEVKSMQSELQALQTQLDKQGQNMLTAYQEKEQDAVRRAERGEMSPVEQENVGKELQAEQEKIMQFRQEIQTKLGKKQEELLNPILERINTAIKDVATEKGLTYIFDTSTGVVLYADESQDVSEAVKAKLAAE